MPATWYYISMEAVAGEETSDRSDTIRFGTGEFFINMHMIHQHKIFCITYFFQKMRKQYFEGEKIQDLLSAGNK